MYMHYSVCFAFVELLDFLKRFIVLKSLFGTSIQNNNI